MRYTFESKLTDDGTGPMLLFLSLLPLASFKKKSIVTFFWTKQDTQRPASMSHTMDISGIGREQHE